MGGERVDHVPDGQTEPLQLPGQPEPVDVGPVERAIAPGRAWGTAQHPAPLVEPHRIDRDADRLRELSDAHPAHCLTLDHGPEFTFLGMTTLLAIPSAPEAPIACDLSGARETPTQRRAEYGRLFDQAFVDRASTGTEVLFRFAVRPGVVEWLLDLVRREATCCPFLSYEVDLAGEHVVWRIAGKTSAELSLVEELVTPTARRTG